VKETSFFPGACFEDDAGFGELRSPDNEKRERAWLLMFNHYQASLRHFTKMKLAMARLSADDDAIDEIAGHAWDRLMESFSMRDGSGGEVTVFDTLSSIIENRVRSVRRNPDHRRTMQVMDLLHNPTLANMSEDELLDLVNDDYQPSLEHNYEQYENRQWLFAVLAAVLERNLTPRQRQLAALWYIYGYDTHAINAYYRKEKLDNTLSRAKHEFADALSLRLWRKLTQHPADTNIMQFFLMVESFRNTDKDGDLTQTHAFIKYLHQIMPHPLPDLSDTRWFQLLITKLKGGSQ